MYVICSEVRFVEISSPNECDKILKIPNEQTELTDYMQGRIKRGEQGALAPGPPFSKGPPATEKKTINTNFNYANVIKVSLIWLLSAS